MGERLQADRGQGTEEVVADNKIIYDPPPTIKEFIKDHLPGELFYDWIVGPVGSGKTTAIFFKLIHMAKMQEKSPDGIRRTRCVVVRNTAPQLRDTTIVSWNYWFKHGQAGIWRATDKSFMLRFGDVECEVLFRALDTPDDVARVLSLEVTFGIIDEFVQTPQEIINALSARLGRYPSKVECPGGATNWGMWGASNPDTEDNWWFDDLHDDSKTEKISVDGSDYDKWKAERETRIGNGQDLRRGRNVRYYLQPSGFSTEAENVENLPGGRGYYTNQAKGKSEAWIKQFLEAEWGFSAAGRPVVPTFTTGLHIQSGLRYNPELPLIAGIDPGLTGSALIFGQVDLQGRLNVLGELIQQGFGAERLVTERIRPYISRHFPGAKLILAPDPAAANRSQTDEKSVVETLKRYFEVSIESNNRLAIRLEAIEYFTTRLVDGKPALAVDAKKCPVLLRALKGGWRYILDTKYGTVTNAKPDKKNPYSHPGDGFGYLCRYFHRGAERELRNKKFVIPRGTPIDVPVYNQR